jgi:hypothetical protein
MSVNLVPPIPDAASSVTGPDSYGDSPAVGISTSYAREDHDHGLPSASGGGATSISYADLMTLIGSSGLTPGAQYLITDYATVHYIVDGNYIPDLTTIITGVTEPLIVTADSVNTIDKEAKSTLYPQDIIYYDPSPTKWLYDLSFSDTSGPTIIPGFKGVIYFRHDTILDNYMGYDFRNVKFRRWDTNVGMWSDATPYTRGSFTEYTGIIYRALTNNLASKAQIDTITLTSLLGSGTADVTAAGGLTKTATFNTDLPTTASDFVAAYAVDYAAVGIVISTTGIGDIVFTAAVAGVPFTSPVITNVVPDLAGTVVNTQANVTAPVPSIGSHYWAECVDLTTITYWNPVPSAWNGITSGPNHVDVKTFAESGSFTYDACCRNNHFETFKDISLDTYYTILMNNVFWLGASNPDLYDNELGAVFSNNTVNSNGFQNNSIDPFFINNLVGPTFQCNNVGSNSESNIIYENFLSNTIGSFFSFNTLSNNFQNNTISSHFNHNNIGEGFGGNNIGYLFQLNTINQSFDNNEIGSNFGTNIINYSFNANIIGDYCANNTIDHDFANNVVGSNFGGFGGNNIGSNFNNNSIGNSFFEMTIGDAFGYNTVGNYSHSDVIGSSCANNTFGNNFVANTIGNVFSNNTVLDNIDSVDFSSATLVYINVYNKIIQKRLDGTAVLSYIDNSNVLTIVAATT